MEIIRVQVSGIYSYDFETLPFCKDKGLSKSDHDNILKVVLWENCLTEFI